MADFHSARLSEAFPDKTFVCLERDPELAAQTSRWASHSSVRSAAGTLSDLPDEMRFDFVLGAPYAELFR